MGNGFLHSFLPAVPLTAVFIFFSDHSVLELPSLYDRIEINAFGFSVFIIFLVLQNLLFIKLERKEQPKN